MSRKEIVFLSGIQIMLILIIVGNALVVGFFMRWHSYKVFRQEDADLSTFSLAQRREHDIKEEIRIAEGSKTWNETAYVKKNNWSIDIEEEKIETSSQMLNLLK